MFINSLNVEAKTVMDNTVDKNNGIRIIIVIHELNWVYPTIKLDVIEKKE